MGEPAVRLPQSLDSEGLCQSLRCQALMIRHPHAIQSHFSLWGLNREQMILGGATLTLVIFVLLIQLPWLSFFQWVLGFFKWTGKNGIAVGAAYLPDQARLRHTHIVGATGTGKTVLLEELLFQDLNRGYGAIVVDPKGERSFYEGVRNHCRSIGREK